MPKYEGPCKRCGIYVERNIKAGREGLCVPCAIRKSTDQQRSMAKGTDSTLQRCGELGREAGRQMREGSGPAYDKWLAGLKRHIDKQDTTADT